MIKTFLVGRVCVAHLPRVKVTGRGRTRDRVREIGVGLIEIQISV